MQVSLCASSGTLQRLLLWGPICQAQGHEQRVLHCLSSSHPQAEWMLAYSLGLYSPLACTVPWHELKLLPLQDVMGMVRNLHLVLTNEQVRCQLQINARQTAEQFTPVAIAER